MDSVCACGWSEDVELLVCANPTLVHNIAAEKSVGKVKAYRFI